MAAPIKKGREATEAGADGVVPKPECISLKRLGFGTTPALRATPPNLGGEFNSEASHHSFGLRRERGSVTVYFAIFTLIFLGLMTMATDFGRLYLIQAELQTAADAAALAAARHLVGTVAAVSRALEEVDVSFDSTTGNENRFNLRINQIGGSGSLVTSREVDFFSALLDARGNVNGGQAGGI
ncbi:MAG: hypothetical protein HY646_02670, partial [Acidobacteria bacterium]|nr:hypothetical protein [Acidobacteriota bacterium]